MDLTQVLISAVAGLISGTLASLVAPWVNWGIERHRIRFSSKQSLIADARNVLLSSNGQKEIFRNTVEYSRLKPFLRKEVISIIESSNPILEPVLNAISTIAGDENHFTHLILDEIANLEKKWKLI